MVGGTKRISAAGVASRCNGGYDTDTDTVIRLYCYVVRLCWYTVQSNIFIIQHGFAFFHISYALP